jgi:hypothetical protein
MGASRGVFEVDNRKVSYDRLIEVVKQAKPTLIFVGYGGNAAFAGPAGLDGFVKQYSRLLDDLRKLGADIVLITPNRHEPLGPPLPDPAKVNEHLQLYSNAIGKLAADRGHALLDLNELTGKLSLSKPLTDNGVHFTDYGYWRAAALLDEGLGLKHPVFRMRLHASGKLTKAEGATVRDIERTATGLRWRAKPDMLPQPPAPDWISHIDEMRLVQVEGLPANPGAGVKYELRVDGKPVTPPYPIETWADGIGSIKGPEFEQAEALRLTILDKNSLFFHRWRPQNETYLFLFRKHEQGQNAKEIPMFDPLIEEKEAEIAKLRVPREHVYELVRVKGGE